MSEWNSLGLWTGWTDVSLAPEGVAEAKAVGVALAAYPIHSAHVSELKRTHETFAGIKEGFGKDIPVRRDAALNERHYGAYTGKNKWEIKKEVGDAAFDAMRRGWDVPIPDGETLRAVCERAAPYYETNILPELQAGKSVLVVAHGNTIRALIKHIERISPEDIASVEVGTGEIVAYQATDGGMVRLSSLV